MRARALVVATLLACVAAPGAAADRASDVLASHPVFPGNAARKLTDAIASARARGVDVRVALIANRSDLGSVRRFFRRPRAYARFLGGELRSVYGGRVLVVMPNGLAVSRRGRLVAADARRLSGIHVRDGLAPAAVAAVSRLTGAAPQRRAPSVRSTIFPSAWRLSQRTAVAIAIAVVAAILLPGALVARGRRRRLRRYYGW
jgi:hypothetical protein